MTCAECDKPFEPAPHQAFQQRYCSLACKRRARNRRQDKTRRDREPKRPAFRMWKTCVACDEDFTANSRQKRYCSTHCARTFKSAQAKTVRLCPCGSEFLASGTRRYCSIRCSAKAQQNYNRSWLDKRRQERERDPNGLVYFIQRGDGPIKIGVSSDPEWRLVLLQVGNHEELSLRHVRTGGRALEAELHERFAAHRIRGEWFKPVPELLDLIGGGTLAADPQLRLVS